MSDYLWVPVVLAVFILVPAAAIYFKRAVVWVVKRISGRDKLEAAERERLRSEYERPDWRAYMAALGVRQMEPLFSRILNARRKRFFGSKPIFEPYKPATDIDGVEVKVGATLPASLRAWLVAAGYGDICEVLSFRSEWFNSIDRGELQGHVMFAQDEVGNFYSFSPIDGAIHFICRSAPEFAMMATDFGSFLEEFERRNFQLQAWTDSLKALPYNWGT